MSTTKRWMVGCALALVMSPGAMALKIGGGGDPRKIDLSQTFDFSADPATQAKTYMVTTGNMKLKQVKRVAVSSCTIGIVVGKSASGKSSGATMSWNASTSSPFPGGIPTQRIREAVDNFCDQIEVDLKGAGYELVPYEELAAKPSFQKYASKFVSEPETLGEDINLGNQKGAEASNVVLMVSGKNRPFPKDIRIPKLSTVTARAKLGYKEDMEGITMLDVFTTLDFATVDAKGGFWHGAKTDMKYAQFIPPGETLSSAYFSGSAGGRSFWQKQAMVAAKNPFVVEGSGKVSRDGSYDDVAKVSTFTTTEKSTIDADHVLWSANANSLLKALSAMFIQALKDETNS